MATPDTLQSRLSSFLLGVQIVLLAQLWGVCFEAIKTLVFNLGPEVAEQMHSTPALRELLALGYQFGYLMLPAVTPIIIWFVLYQGFVQALAPRFIAATER